MKIFLASPGDLSHERESLKMAVGRQIPSDNGDIVDVNICGWEDVDGGLGRPQAIINQEIIDSDYMICLFKSDWGSDPGGDELYSSGTEEELFQGLLAALDKELPMKDIWLCFVEAADVSPSVLDFKKRVTYSKSLLYVQAEDTEDLKEKVRNRIASWAEKSAAGKKPRAFDLETSTGKHPIRLRQDSLLAVETIEAGRQDIGLTKLREIAIDGGAAEWLLYSKYLAQAGSVDESEKWVDQSLEKMGDTFERKYSTLGIEAISQKGYILKKKGDYLAAEIQIGKYLERLGEIDAETEALARLYDNYGLCLQFNRSYSRAHDAFSRSREIRLGRYDKVQVAQSDLNISRLYLRQEMTEDAKPIAEKANRVLEATYEMGLRANCQVLLAQIAIKEENYITAVEFADRAYAYNSQVNNVMGQAASLYTKAEACRRAGDVLNARKSYIATSALNESMGNDKMVSRVQTILQDMQS